jgi:cation transport ATPase
MTASTKPRSALSVETYIAAFTLLAILLHLVFRYLLHYPSLTSDFPLFVALFAGSPLLFTLLKKLVKREFGSDLLAGISIVTAVILGQYLVAAIVVLMLSGEKRSRNMPQPARLQYSMHWPGAYPALLTAAGPRDYKT